MQKSYRDGDRDELRGWWRVHGLDRYGEERKDERGGRTPWKEFLCGDDTMLLDVRFFKLVNALECFAEFVCATDSVIFPVGDTGYFFERLGIKLFLWMRLASVVEPAFFCANGNGVDFNTQFGSMFRGFDRGESA
jgi:hypothetical protein